MKDLILLLIILAILLTIWLFPVIIAFITWNFWYILLYAVWWFPAVVISAFLAALLPNY